MQDLTPPPELFGRIISQIHTEQRLQILKKRLAFYVVAFTVSLPALLFLLKDLSMQINRTGFFQMLQLAYTDFRVVSANFSDYFLSLVESLPSISAAFTGIVLLSLLFSLAKLLSCGWEIKQLEK
ncbi:MAG: hypothetical protein M1383_00260 [Patescibacteria group bacterium]|nr:hypothetical protein [Patescibacteria group bacterium]